MKGWIFFFFYLALCIIAIGFASPWMAFADTTTLKTGAGLGYEVPLRDPSHPAASDPNSAAEYGRYTLLDVRSSFLAAPVLLTQAAGEADDAIKLQVIDKTGQPRMTIYANGAIGIE